MKFRLLYQLSLLSAGLSAQTPDSVAIRQVDSLILVSRDFNAKKDFDKAIEINAKAEKIAFEKLGRESAAYGTCAFNRGFVNYFKKEYKESEKWHLEAISIRERVIGKEHLDYIKSLLNLANLYMDMGNNGKAESMYLEAKAIGEKVLGKEHLLYAKILYALAFYYQDLPSYEKAEPLYLESSAIREKVLGKVHPDYAWCLSQLAILYNQMGNYEKSESLYFETMAILEKVTGKDHPDYAYSLHNLANLYRSMGNYEKAEMCYFETRVIFEKVLGKEHPDYARCLHNLAILYEIMGSYKKAEPLYLEAKTIREKVLGGEHPDYARCLVNLAILYDKMGSYKQAELLCLEGITIFEHTLSSDHPDYANSLVTLAAIYVNLGYYEKAEPLYLNAKTIREKILGKEHPHHANSLENLVGLYELQGRFSESASLLSELHDLNQTQLSKAITYLSERELENYTAIFLSNGSALGAFMLTRLRHGLIGAEFGQLEILSGLGYNHALFYKGFLLTAAAQLNTIADGSPESKEINIRIKSYRRQLAAEYAKPISDRKNVSELEEKTNTAEKELARSIAAYADAKRQVKWEEVLASLKKDETAIEFVSFKVSFPRETDSIMYAALLTNPGTKQPRFIPLFEEKQLDSLLQTSGERKADYVNNLYSLADRGAAVIEGPQRSLYELIWQPLEKELSDVQTIYFSPTGLLHRLNLGAIPISEEQTVTDRYRLVELGSTRQLVIPSKVNLGQNDALLFGGIQYESDSTFLVGVKKSETMAGLASRGGLSFSISDSTLRGGNWNYLKWTDKEVTGLESILNVSGFQTTLRKGMSATEEEFKTIGQGKSSPRLLHLATHGFFFPDPKQAASLRGGLGESEPVFKMSDHPMIRSGLILAGGNHAWNYGKPVQEGMEDGILTAYEISQMNLSNTELVVLSACETGLGDIQGNEGVYGLQRAFKIAGAKYLIMSLWQVPDQETSVFMTTFYKNWLDHKMSIPDAFRKTQQEMRERFINPYQWAGFVLVE